MYFARARNQFTSYSTGCRRGELLTLRWKDVRLKDRVIVLQAAATKTHTMRAVPISQRLRAILEMRRYGPDGKELGPDAFVFGTEVGERRRDTRNAWLTACEKAGITDLHMHDLRRECGSRLLESGAGLHEVREWLGHTDIGTTGRYLAVTAESLKRTLNDWTNIRPHRSRRSRVPRATRPLVLPLAPASTETSQEGLSAD